MAPNNAQRVRSMFRVLWLIGLVVSAWVSTHQAPVVGTNAGPTDMRTFEWRLIPEDFGGDENGYLSPVECAASAFAFATAFLEPIDSLEGALALELRLRADDEDWSPWYSIGDLEPEPNGRWYGESLVGWPHAREVQVRVRVLLSGQEENLRSLFRELTIIGFAMDGGPTTEEALSAARARQQAQLLATQNGSGVPRPIIISRAEWGANENWMNWPPDYEPVEKMMVHHTVSGGGVDPAAEVRTIYYYHAVTRGWGDIGYNFLVDRFGNIYEGRYGGVDAIGAHVGYWNDGSMGMSVLGCYDNPACSYPRYPTSDSLDALSDLVAWTASRRAIDPRELKVFSNGYSYVTNYVLAGHRDYASTACPGGNLYAELPGLRQAAWQKVPEYDARFGWHDTPSFLNTGQQVTVYPNLFNYGRMTWSDDSGVRLGYRWIKDGQVVAENRSAARIIPGAVVKFGEMTALVAQLTAPHIPGSFTLRWDMYQDGVGWFADQPPLAGRSQPLEVTVEIAPALALDVELHPQSVPAGTPVHVDITVQGLVGQAFVARTVMPVQISFVPGSAQSDYGNITHVASEVTWAGTLGGPVARAKFDVLVSPELTSPLALSTTTTLSAFGYTPLTVERWLIVNGHPFYLPLIDYVWQTR